MTADAQTYKNLLYLLVRFPLGIAYLTVFVVGLSVGMALVPLLVGIPILAGVLAVAGYVGVLEAALLRTFFARDTTCSTLDPGETPVVPYVKQATTDSKHYLLLLLALSSFVTGNALFVGLVVWFALSLSFSIAPAVYWIDGIQYVNLPASIDLGIATISGERLAINTLPEALLVSLVGIILTVLGFHLINLTARIYADSTEKVLSASD